MIQFPAENREFIEQFCGHLGVTQFERTSGYIKGFRPPPHKPLHIAYGWTNGFVSEEEARAATGGAAEVWESENRRGLWGVSHPFNRIGHGGGGPASAKPDHGTCPKCFIQLPATGLCDECD